MIIKQDDLRCTVTIEIYKVDGKHVAKVENDEYFDVDPARLLDRDLKALIAELDEEAENEVRNDAA